VGRVEEFLIVSCLELFRRKDQVKVTHVLLLVKVALPQLLGSHFLSFLRSYLSLALDGPALEFEGFLLFVLHFLEVTQVEQLDHVSDQILLHLEIKWRISAEGGRMVDLDDPGLELLVKEDIEAEDLEAHGVFHVVWLARPVGVR